MNDLKNKFLSVSLFQSFWLYGFAVNFVVNIIGNALIKDGYVFTVIVLLISHILFHIANTIQVYYACVERKFDGWSIAAIVIYILGWLIVIETLIGA